MLKDQVMARIVFRFPVLTYHLKEPKNVTQGFRRRWITQQGMGCPLSGVKRSAVKLTDKSAPHLFSPGGTCGESCV